VLPDATGSSNAGHQGCMNHKEKVWLASNDAGKDEEISEEQVSFSRKRGRHDETQLQQIKPTAELFARFLVLLDLDTGRPKNRIGAAVPV
jgi:hypothetical protein